MRLLVRERPFSPRHHRDRRPTRSPAGSRTRAPTERRSPTAGSPVCPVVCERTDPYPLVPRPPGCARGEPRPLGFSVRAFCGHRWGSRGRQRPHELCGRSSVKRSVRVRASRVYRSARCSNPRPQHLPPHGRPRERRFVVSNRYAEPRPVVRPWSPIDPTTRRAAHGTAGRSVWSRWSRPGPARTGRGAVGWCTVKVPPYGGQVCWSWAQDRDGARTLGFDKGFFLGRWSSTPADPSRCPPASLLGHTCERCRRRPERAVTSGMSAPLGRSCLERCVLYAV